VADKKFKKKLRIGPPRNPDDEWNDPEIPVPDTLAQCKQIQKMIADADQSVWRKAYDYFNNTDKMVGEIAETIERINKVTKAQKGVLDRALAGVTKWTDPAKK
jgi:hypothetical protein